MPGNPLIKAINQADADVRVYQNRLEPGGLPYRARGPVPLLTEEEFEDRLVRVCDVKNGVFDLGDAAQNESYLNILRGVSRGWYEVIDVKKLIDLEKGVRKAYVEWREWYMEDGRPAEAPAPDMWNGYQDGAGHPRAGA